MKYREIVASTTVFLLGGSTGIFAAQGDDSAFFQQRSQNVYNAVFGLPVVAPRLVQTLEWQASLEYSNQFAGGSAGSENLVLDGETARLTLNHRQRLSPCWQLEATVPFISHDGGVFDRAIDDWHSFFGLPDGNRDSIEFNRLTYEYSDQNGVRQSITRPQSGIGDVQIAVQRALGCYATADATKADAMIRVGIKLPTGNPNELRGSGEVDLYADWQSPIWNNGGRWHAGMAVGLLVNGKTDRFADQRNIAVYGSAGAQFAIHHNFRLIAQLDAHSAFYRSALTELGDPAVNLAFGARYLAGSSYTYEFSISEDVVIDTTPDIVARLAVTYRPDHTRSNR